MYLTCAVYEAMAFDGQSHHAAGERSEGVDKTAPIRAQGRTRQITELGDEIVRLVFLPFVEVWRLM